MSSSSKTWFGKKWHCRCHWERKRGDLVYHLWAFYQHKKIPRLSLGMRCKSCQSICPVTFANVAHQLMGHVQDPHGFLGILPTSPPKLLLPHESCTYPTAHLSTSQDIFWPPKVPAQGELESRAAEDAVKGDNPVAVVKMTRSPPIIAFIRSDLYPDTLLERMIFFLPYPLTNMVHQIMESPISSWAGPISKWATLANEAEHPHSISRVRLEMDVYTFWNRTGARFESYIDW